MQEVVDGSDTFTYSYVNDSDLLQSVTGPVMNTTYSYEPNRNVKTTVDNSVSGTTVSKYSYDYDELSRRENRVQEGSAFSQGSFDDFEYNPRSEVTGSERFAGTDPADQTNPLTGLDFAYASGPAEGQRPTGVGNNIGNRLSFNENSDLTEYVANELNQYSQINDGSTLEPTHDADGNLTFDGQFNYSWNGENRLVQVTSAVVTEGAKRLTFWYDHQGRRFQKRVEEYQSGTWTEIELTRFLYDDWNLIAEYDATSGTNTLSRTYTWGLDLSQTPQGAGGVGGLLSMTEETASETFYYAFDANGNVTQLIDESGNLSAHYEYSPFGQLTTSSGPMADENPFRFSTKYQDEATGLLYYGFRYYDAEMGRWLSRDPIQERGGVNVYCFVGNNAITSWDYVGLCWDYIKARHQWYWGLGDVTLDETGCTSQVSNAIDSDLERYFKDIIKPNLKKKEKNIQVRKLFLLDPQYTVVFGGLGELVCRQVGIAKWRAKQMIVIIQYGNMNALQISRCQIYILNNLKEYLDQLEYL